MSALIDSTATDPSSARDDFSREPVPDASTFSGLHIALVIIGGVIGIPAFLQASQIGGSLGLQSAIYAFAAGCLILGVLGGLTSYVGAKTRYSTYMLTEFAFGRQGAKLVNVAIAISLIGWFAVICNVFADAAQLTLSAAFGLDLPKWFYVFLGSSLFVGVTLSGFKGIDKLALFLVPLMLIFLAYAAGLSWDDVPSWTATSGDMQLTFSTAVSSVVGGYISGVVIQPDYSRFARNVSHAVWAAFLALFIVQAAVFFMAAIPSVATGELDLIKIMVSLGIGIPAFLLLLLSAWCSNVLCLYSSALSFSTVAPQIQLKSIIFFVGVVGTALAFGYSPDYFIGFLVLLGIAIPPIASIYVIDIILIRRGLCETNTLQKEPSIDVAAFVAWILASVVGYLTLNEYLSLTGASALDTIVLASVIYAGLNLKRIRQSRFRANS